MPADTPILRTTALPYLRRAHAGDATALGAFLHKLSAHSSRFRFHGACSAASQPLLKLLCDVDHVRHHAWLAWVGAADAAEVVGEVRFVAVGDRGAELAIAVADAWQGTGVADLLMRRMLGAAARSGVRELYGDVMDSNKRMLDFMRRHCFKAERLGNLVRVRRDPAPLA